MRGGKRAGELITASVDNVNVKTDIEHKTPTLIKNQPLLNFKMKLGTLLVLGLGVVLIQIQVRLEEEFLSGAHGADYSEYRRDVRRWL